MLANPDFESQLSLLLAQLVNEGFDVSGPMAEFNAMRDIIRGIDGAIAGLLSFHRDNRLQA
jgi:hypothetical protein